MKKKKKIKRRKRNTPLIYKKSQLAEMIELNRMKNSIIKAFPDKQDRQNYINSLIQEFAI